MLSKTVTSNEPGGSTIRLLFGEGKTLKDIKMPSSKFMLWLQNKITNGRLLNVITNLEDFQILTPSTMRNLIKKNLRMSNFLAKMFLIVGSLQDQLYL